MFMRVGSRPSRDPANQPESEEDTDTRVKVGIVPHVTADATTQTHGVEDTAIEPRVGVGADAPTQSLVSEDAINGLRKTEDAATSTRVAEDDATELNEVIEEGADSNGLAEEEMAFEAKITDELMVLQDTQLKLEREVIERKRLFAKYLEIYETIVSNVRVCRSSEF